MDLTQIRYFLALARTLNFTRAAECGATALMAGPRQQDGRSLRGATMA